MKTKITTPPDEKPEPRGRGRPQYQPTDDEREKVRVLRAGGMNVAAIAEAIGIAETTLRIHFSEDLEIGAAKVTADVMMARYRAAMGGNVSAQNRLLEQMGAVPPATRKPKAETEPKLGKKEQAERDAETAHEGNQWGSLLN